MISGKKDIVDLVKILHDLELLVKKTAEFIAHEQLGFKMGAVHDKGRNQLVSFVDQKAEEMLVKGLREILPSAGFLTEEETVLQEQNETLWIVDPLDGTTNFIYQIPFYSISVALQLKSELVLGLVYNIPLKECFKAVKGSGAYLNDVRITCATRPLEESLLATGFPFHKLDRKVAYIKVFENLMGSCRGIRRLGSAALDLAYVAAGRFDAFFEFDLKLWDVAAGLVLLEEAGGIASDLNGAHLNVMLKGKEVREIVAGSAYCHPEVLEKIKIEV